VLSALDLMRSLWRVNHSLERVSMSMEARLGVTAQQRMMIRLIGQEPEVAPGRLAERLHVDAGTVSAALKRLERRGLVRRRANREDRRRVAISLTARGTALDRPTPGTVEAAVRRMVTIASRRDVRATERVLAALCDALDLETRRR
jgi:DNA-binding MarR family transcriptional regulator